MLSTAQSVSIPRSDGQEQQDRTAQDSHDGELARDRVLDLVAALAAVAFPFAPNSAGDSAPASSLTVVAARPRRPASSPHPSSREGWKQISTP